MSKMSEACEHVQQLLPWVANRTAASAEVAAVYGHIARCPACRRQLAQTLALQRRLQEAAEALPAMPPGRWDRLAAALTPPAGEMELLLKRWLPTLEACGLPPVVTELVRLGRTLQGRGWTVSVDVPLSPTVTVRA